MNNQSDPNKIRYGIIRNGGFLEQYGSSGPGRPNAIGGIFERQRLTSSLRGSHNKWGPFFFHHAAVRSQFGHKILSKFSDSFKVGLLLRQYIVVG
ncbi:hypothetical protein FE783_23590 [Paenibacillus mesophilus]|uniref:hypothetical protein n=1 Tax=Paenibacillus mesophilus TaxID=2582849 RepID=UPI00110E9701|nr:hypothetical protein [Paenibacillus mesophilus]TMV47221.1 hypothetical protein FE783_23590 [Paenibacillus mesophilus]